MMKIGSTDVSALARLAPMAGVTDAPFRLIARECGSGLTTTEEMDAAALLMNHPHADAIAAYYSEERPLAMRLLGKDADRLARAAERCRALGADIRYCEGLVYATIADSVSKSCYVRDEVVIRPTAVRPGDF